MTTASDEDGRAHVFPPVFAGRYDVVDGRVRTRALEAHVIDHCNLKCAECCSLSPLLPPWFARPGPWCLPRQLDSSSGRTRWG